MKRELLEEIGYPASDAEIRHVWHQEVVSSTYSKDWDGAIHDYFLVRCDLFTVPGDAAPGLLADEGITEFRWWRLAEMERMAGPETFRPENLPNLLQDLLSGPAATLPICI